MTLLNKIRNGAFGIGLMEDIIEAYNFIVNNYLPGDEIFLFGFSRGAYAVRAVAGLLCELGILKPKFMSQFPKILEIYRKRVPEKPLDGWHPWEKACEGIQIVNKKEDIIIQVIGVWDTVASLGIPDILSFKTTCFRKKFQFYDTGLHSQIKHAFQALALDETRNAYEPILWKLPLNNPSTPNTDLCQTWFPGVHINIGGGPSDKIKRGHKQGSKQNPKRGHNTLANLSLAWMIDMVQPYLAVEWDGVEDEILDTNMTDEIRRSWWPLGREVRTPGKYHNHAKEDTMERIHPSVFFRHHSRNAYDPPALRDRVREFVNLGRWSGWVWKTKDAHYLWEFQIAKLPRDRSAEKFLIAKSTQPWVQKMFEEVTNGWKYVSD